MYKLCLQAYLHLGGSKFRGRPQFNSRRCTGCGACYNICPTQAIEIIDDHQKNRRKIELWIGACIFCGYCEDTCPEGAIKLANKPVHPSHNKKLFGRLETDLAICEICGRAFSSAPLQRKVLSILRVRDSPLKTTKFEALCEKCKRFSYAKIYARPH